MVKILEAGADQFGGEQCTELLLGLVHDGQVSEARIDESAERVLLVKFRLGLFDDPFVDEEAAATLVGNAASRRAGLEAQSRSVTVLKNGDGTKPAVLPLTPGLKVYAEGVDLSVLSRVCTAVATPEEAEVAFIRIEAPYEPRDDLFLESYFHQGSLEMRPGLVHRLRKIASTVPLVLDVALDRPALLDPVLDAVSGLTVTFGVSDEALIAALTGQVPPAGRLPVEIPRSMEAIRHSAPDVPSSTRDPLFPLGFHLDIV